MLRLLSTLALAVSLAGCINSSTVINVKADGSGTIEQTMTMNPQVAAQLQQMAGSFGQQDAQKKGGFFNEQDLRAAAPKMGDGVTFVSAAPIKTPEAEGTKAIYAFTDITKLRLNQKPSTPGEGGGMQAMPGGSGAEDMLFRFAKTPAGTSRVTVVFPDRKIDQARKTAPAAQPAAKTNDPMQAAALAMMKQMLNGLRISIVMQPAGRIIKTNSPYVEGQRVTLLEMDLGQLLADEGKLQQLQAAGSLEDAKALLKGIKGMKINTDQEVSVEFR